MPEVVTLSRHVNYRCDREDCGAMLRSGGFYNNEGALYECPECKTEYRLKRFYPIIDDVTVKPRGKSSADYSGNIPELFPEPPETGVSLEDQASAVDGVVGILATRRPALIAALATLRWVQGLKGGHQ